MSPSTRSKITAAKTDPMRTPKTAKPKRSKTLLDDRSLGYLRDRRVEVSGVSTRAVRRQIERGLLRAKGD